MPVITTYNCDLLTGGGNRALDAISIYSLLDGDRAIVADGTNVRFFEYQYSASDAEDTSFPAKIRPDDYVSQGVWYEQATMMAPSDILTKLKTVDGTGSGLDADLLDGQEGSYYLSAGSVGAGTDNHVVRYDGASALQDSGVIIDDSDFVGLGTTNPTSRLHVEDVTTNCPMIYCKITNDAGSAGVIKLDSAYDRDVGIVFANQGSAQWAMLNDGAATPNNSFMVSDRVHAYFPFKIELGAPTNLLYLDASGYVGINTDSPGVALDVNGAIKAKNDINTSSTWWTNSVASLLLSNGNASGDPILKFEGVSNRIVYGTALTTDKLIFSSRKEGSGSHTIIFDYIGNVGIGLTPTANMVGLSIEAGLLTLKETTTPTADTNYGKIYTKSDNKLYFQDGAGTEHEISLVS